MPGVQQVIEFPGHYCGRDSYDYTTRFPAPPGTPVHRGLNRRRRIPVRRKRSRIRNFDSDVVRDDSLDGHQRYLGVGSSQMHKILERRQRYRGGGVDNRLPSVVPTTRSIQPACPGKCRLRVSGFADPVNDHATKPCSIRCNSSSTSLVPASVSTRSNGMRSPRPFCLEDNHLKAWSRSSNTSSASAMIFAVR